MHIVSSVQARLGSTRLPGKVLFHLGDRRVFQWVVDRTRATSTVDKTVATIGDRPENDAITTYCERSEIEYFVGPEDDLLARHLAVADRTDCDVLVRVTGDCPFVPGQEIDRVVREHLSNDAQYTTNATDEMPIGTAVDAIDTATLTELSGRGDSHPVRRLREDSDEWDVVFTPNEQLSSFSGAHVAVDTPADYWTLLDAIESVGDEPHAVIEWMAER